MNESPQNSSQELSFAPDPEKPLRFFGERSDFQPTPLREFTLSSGLTLAAKDETGRLGLGSFKALGAPYALAQLVASRWFEKTGERLPPHRFADEDVRAFAGELTFVCASAGNHGIGLAAGARALGAHARVLVSRTVPDRYLDRIAEQQAEVVRAGDNYEESVAASIEDAQRTGAILLSDVSWPGYHAIPSLVMEGYTVMAEELRASFDASGRWPSHVFLQAGVGGMAAAMAHMIRVAWAVQPQVIIVEPTVADCLKASHEAGTAITVEGPVSNMGRLDCKTPSLIAWHTLERCDVTYQLVTDEQAAAAAAELTGMGIPTTPSGAAGLAGLKEYQFADTDRKTRLPLIMVTECDAAGEQAR